MRKAVCLMVVGGDGGDVSPPLLTDRAKLGISLALLLTAEQRELVPFALRLEEKAIGVVAVTQLPLV